MKIKDLKQPYRRMAEYYRIVERSELTGRIEIYTPNQFPEPEFNHWFWTEIKKGNHPPITEEIKKHFPPDFDFSGEDEYPNNQCDEACYYHCTEGGNIKPKCINERYTKLAKEGKFDQLPDTCEFSEPVEMLVNDYDNESNPHLKLVVGKYRTKYVTDGKEFINGFAIWNYAQLPTKKIDFSQFNSGDVVEVELSNEEKRIGWFDYTDRNQVVIKTLKRKGNQVCNGGSCSGSKMFNLEKIKSITKIK